MGFDNLNGVLSERTEHQVPAHEGFRPSQIARHESRKFASDGERTPRLASPPAWTERGDMPCVIPRGARGELARAHADKWDPGRGTAAHKVTAADKLCSGCPVTRECLEDALEEEAGLSGDYRYLIRGGLLPHDRARLAGMGGAA